MKFTEQKIESSAVYNQINLTKFSVGSGIVFYINDLEDRTSDQFGDFKVCVGLSLDENVKSYEEFIASGVLSSFIPNTQLTNLITNNQMKLGEVYRITKSWNRGDKFKDGKVAKGNGYDVVKLGVDVKQLNNLSAAFLKLKEESTSDDSNASNDSNQKPTL